MTTRRTFMTTAAIAAALAPTMLAAQTATGSGTTTPTNGSPLPMNAPTTGGKYRPLHRIGLGGVPLGNGFGKVVPEYVAFATVQAAWDAGIRLYDTAPTYGYGRAERRLVPVLSNMPREEFVLSTKVGRVLHPDHTKSIEDLWIFKDAPPFTHTYDYSASGVRRSIEDSLQRLGLSYIDIVYVHDLGPSTGDFPNGDWRAQFEIARTGAFPELTRMREEGIIKGWGLGINEADGALATLEVADPDIILLSYQYSLADHSTALDGVLPALQARGVHAMGATPLNTGFLNGRDRYNAVAIPEAMHERRARMQNIARSHGVDLGVAALQFVNAHPAYCGLVPGASHPDQVRQNVAAFSVNIPADFWAELRQEQLLDERAPIPA